MAKIKIIEIILTALAALIAACKAVIKVIVYMNKLKPKPTAA